MRTPPQILLVDDNPLNLDIFQTRLAAHGYEILTATDGEAALEMAREHRPDLILLDIMMPKVDGIEVCRQLKADPALPFLPIIMVTAKAGTSDIVAGLNAGADEYLTKPVDQTALVARVQSMLRIKALHDTVQAQAVQLEAQSAQLAEWNCTLEARVQEQVAELERISRLRRFVSPQLAEVIISSGDDSFLAGHRQEISVVFCDLRGFTPFTERAEPEEMMAVLREYHEAMGRIVHEFQGTVGRFAGDGLMIFFNDPTPCPEPAACAVKMAVAMRHQMAALTARWQDHGYELGFGVGITLGYATLGRLGFEGRFEYEPNGTVVNLAARLCNEARDGQILVNQRVYAAVQDLVEAQRLPDLTLKGLLRPVPTYDIMRLVDNTT